jgi:glycosyltransferase involved in cell wall biosynthesis
VRILRIDSWEGRPGGGQVYVRSVADELTARGHPQRLLNIVSEAPADPRPDERYLVTPSPGRERLGEDLVASAEFDGLFQASVEEFQPELVHLHRFDALFTPIARCLERVDVPLVFTAHDAELVCPISTLVRPGGVICEGGVLPRCLFTGCDVGVAGLGYNLWQRQVFDRQVAPRVRAFLCPSQLLAQYLHVHGYRPAIHLPPFARIPPEVARAAYPPPPSVLPPTIGYIGRLEPYKGVQDLLAATALVARTIPTLRLEIAGDGSYRSELVALAESLGIGDRVLWRGFVEGDAKEAWFRGVHVVAVPSNVWENFGLVALEALTRGRPVVATDFGGLPDIVQDGATGRLVPVSRPDRLAAALIELLTDPARGAAMAAEGRSRMLARFTPELHLTRLLAVYESVLAGRPLSSPMVAADLVAAAT